MTSDAICAYYASLGEREWARLENPDDGAVEFAMTCHTLAVYLPPDARVLDIGGGPGRYAIWLAQRGCRVVLADPSSELLSTARAKIDQAGVGTMVEEILEADARDLSHWPMVRSMQWCAWGRSTICRIRMTAAVPPRSYAACFGLEDRHLWP